MSVAHPSDAPAGAPGTAGHLPPVDAPESVRILSDAVTAGGGRYLNRHLSWLDFNARVLALAEDPEQPLLERAKFVAIFSSNLDEFFQVRVGGLMEQRSAGLATLSPDGMTVMEQLRAIRARVLELVERQERVFADLVADLESAGLTFCDYRALEGEDRAHLDRVFEDQVFPVLTPLAVDPAHPFPYISNLSMSLAVMVREPGTAIARIARVKVPHLLPRFVALEDGRRFVPLEQLIAAHLDRLFPGMRILGQYPFRVTRNADIGLEEEEAEDLRTAVETFVRRRRRSQQVVRLEIEASTSSEVQSLLLRELDLSPEDVYTVAAPLDLRGLWALHTIDRPDLHDEPWTPVTPPRLAAAETGEGKLDVFSVLEDSDLLVQHPYESFAASVEAFIEHAASDPDVLAIKQTLYRTSRDSPIVNSLIQAAEAGKQVVALVELTARFDEEANIAWAGALEKAGAHVVYGVVGLKTHAKASLVVRREGSRIRRYCHIGTGNYNDDTARLYEDIGLLSANPDLGADLTDFFNYLTGYSRQRDYRLLLVAPLNLRTRLLELIRRESRDGGRIVLKANHVVDPEVIDALYNASQAGAHVDLIVRSACGVRPGMPGISDGMRVRSIVGRFLEHSRIYGFGDADDGDWYIGSADLMARNLDGRVEAMVPVIETTLRHRLVGIVDTLLSDDVLAWELGPDGGWRRTARRAGVNAQRLFMERAHHRPVAQQ